MKKLVFLVSIVILLRPAFPVLEYFAHYEYIAKVLCVNKAKPKLHCNGKCHLMKELAKASEKEAPVSGDKKAPNVQTETLFCAAIEPFDFVFASFDPMEKVNAAYADFYQYLCGKATFQPPDFSV